jgi:1-acyl-sn-glycerol-3-phosphate acyltransferase
MSTLSLPLLAKLFRALPAAFDPVRDELLLSPQERDALLDVARLVVGHCRPELQDAHHIPAQGRTLIVGNHGLMGIDSWAMYPLVFRHTGRFPRGLAEKVLFDLPGLSRLVPKIGAVPGTQDNARAMLQQEELVLVYPGGVVDSFKGPEQRYKLQWRDRLGFVRLAMATQTPIVPVMAAGIDHAFQYLFREKVLFRNLIGGGKSRYDFPVSMGLGPFPLPVKFLFRAAAPILPPPAEALADEAVVRAFHHQVWQRSQAHLDALYADWRAMYLPS